MWASNICGLLRDLVPFKKREKKPMDIFQIFKILQMAPNCAKHHIKFKS